MDSANGWTIYAKVERGEWMCEHVGGHKTKLREHERMERPPHYVICPDCGTHWIVTKTANWRVAYPVIVQVSDAAPERQP